MVTSTESPELLCSYNWQLTESGENLICVPGAPPVWTPHTLPIKLDRDEGPRLVDHHAYGLPKYPFEPVFCAMDVMNPQRQLDDVDIIANRNSLRKLLDFAASRSQEPFRIDLHLVRQTLFLTRREKSALIMTGGRRNTGGYGQNFKKTFTTPVAGLESSSGHPRSCLQTRRAQGEEEGKHVAGRVEDIICTHAAERFGGWEAQHQASLRRLVDLLAWLREKVRGMKRERATLLYDESGGDLHMLEGSTGRGGLEAVLPDDVIKKYWTGRR
ncbi:hypothetical protein LTR17_019482 [Elasticomyces elasticus]|nr:hypothetical protein LTR17_019482 [Elasticomyces elasticus]